MKKIFITLTMLFALILISCSENSIESIDSSQDLKQAIEAKTNLGIYKGVFTTLDSEFRGTIEIEIIDFNNSSLAESFHRATIELQTGDIIFATSKDKITPNFSVDQATFRSNDITFSFSVNGDGSSPVISNVVYKNTEADVVIAKHTTRAPVQTITGTYFCFICQSHPVLNGGEQTFNIVLTTNPLGDSEITTQVVYNGTTFNGIGVQNNCNINGTSTTCDLESGDGVGNKEGFTIGSTPVFWDAKHTFNNEDTVNGNDCSETWGVWSFDWSGGKILGGFKNDNVSDCPVAPETVLINDINTFTGDGFDPNPTAGQLDSDIYIVSGLSDGSLVYGDTGNTGDFARGQSNGSVTTGGVYAFNIDGAGDIALGIQPGGSDFTPGYFEVKLNNTTGNNLTSFTIEYDIYVYNDKNRANSLNFSYSKNGASYVNLDVLDFMSPETADASPTWVKTHKMTEFYTTIPNGQSLYLRFTGDDDTGGGSRDEFAIDNLTLVEVD